MRTYNLAPASPSHWPFAPLTETQHRAQAAQACALRNTDRRAHYAQLQAARAALLVLAGAKL